MGKVSLILLLALGCACPLIFASAPQCPEVPVYELKLTVHDPDAQKFIFEGWNKLVADGKNRGASKMDPTEFHGAQVQVIDNERRYTILAKYDVTGCPYSLLCYILVRTNSSNSLFIDCYGGDLHTLEEPKDQAQYDMFNFLYDNI